MKYLKFTQLTTLVNKMKVKTSADQVHAETPQLFSACVNQLNLVPTTCTTASLYMQIYKKDNSVEKEYAYSTLSPKL